MNDKPRDEYENNARRGRQQYRMNWRGHEKQKKDSPELRNEIERNWNERPSAQESKNDERFSKRRQLNKEKK